MGAAAQLARVGAVADLDHAHDIAVLLAEQSHRAEALGLLQRRGDRAHGIARRDPGVDPILDVAQLLGGDRLRVAEVEAQLVGADVGAGLAYVGAEARAQRGMQQMRGGVVALGGPPRGVIDAREDRLFGRSEPCSRTTSSAWSSPRRKTPSHVARQSPRSAFDRAGVGDLAAAGRVEGGLGELDEHELPVLSCDAQPQRL